MWIILEDKVRKKKVDLGFDGLFITPEERD